MATPTPGVPDRRILRALATSLVSDPCEASRARKTVRDTLTSWGLEDLADDMALIVSELVTNAVQHGEGPIVMVLQQRDDTVLVEVADACPRLPVPRQQSAGDESGRGLSLVEAFSDEWGVRERKRHPGKWVWCSRSLMPAATAHTDQPARTPPPMHTATAIGEHGVPPPGNKPARTGHHPTRALPHVAAGASLPALPPNGSRHQKTHCLRTPHRSARTAEEEKARE